MMATTVPAVAVRWILYVVVAWAGVYTKRWLKKRREDAAQGWPTVEAHIVGSRIQPVPKTSLYLAILQYSYYVAEYRAGEYTHECKSEVAAADFVREFRDKKVQVRYLPSNPDKSVLEQSTVNMIVSLHPAGQ